MIHISTPKVRFVGCRKNSNVFFFQVLHVKVIATTGDKGNPCVHSINGDHTACISCKLIIQFEIIALMQERSGIVGY